jgi:hypothetical protein
MQEKRSELRGPCAMRFTGAKDKGRARRSSVTGTGARGFWTGRSSSCAASSKPACRSETSLPSSHPRRAMSVQAGLRARRGGGIKRKLMIHFWPGSCRRASCPFVAVATLVGDTGDGPASPASSRCDFMVLRTAKSISRRRKSAKIDWPAGLWTGRVSRCIRRIKMPNRRPAIKSTTAQKFRSRERTACPLAGSK